MKLPVVAAALLLSLIACAPAALGQKTCACKAPDNSCDAAAKCQTGGAALCASSSACYAACGGVDADTSYVRISLKINKKRSDQVATELSRKSGRKIIFIPRRKTQLFNLELKNHPVWHALKILNRSGQVLVDGVPFGKLEQLRRELLRGGKVSVTFTDVTVSNAVAKLSFITGRPFRVESGDADKVISISLEEVTLSEIVARISAESGVKVARAQERASTK